MYPKILEEFYITRLWSANIEFRKENLSLKTKVTCTRTHWLNLDLKTKADHGRGDEPIGNQYKEVSDTMTWPVELEENIYKQV